MGTMIVLGILWLCLLAWFQTWLVRWSGRRQLRAHRRELAAEWYAFRDEIRQKRRAHYARK